MRILVGLRSERATPDRRSATGTLGPCEEAALDTALALAGNEGETVAVAVGGEEEVAVLDLALQRGATRAVRVAAADGGLLDYRPVVRLFAAALGRLSPDLILVGARSSDEGLGVMAAALAEQLGLPHVSGILAARLVERGRGPLAIELRRRARSSLDTLEVVAPIVLGIAGAGAASPRPATAPAARTTAIELLELPLPGLLSEELLRQPLWPAAVPSARPAPAVTRDARAFLDRLRDERLL